MTFTGVLCPPRNSGKVNLTRTLEKLSDVSFESNSRWPQTTLAGVRLFTWSWGHRCVAWPLVTPASSSTSCSMCWGLTTPTWGQTGTSMWLSSGDLTMWPGWVLQHVSEKRSDKKNWSNFSPNVRVVRRTIFHTNATPLCTMGSGRLQILHNQVVIRFGLLPTSIKVNNHFCVKLIFWI